MIIRYFPDTDTLYLAFTEREVAETVDFNEDTLLDIDADGNIVAITVEHARARVDLSDISFQQVIAAEPIGS
ncbi:MAG TPA: DUF2283 domain-containing protein [Promineifilum sp.]|nr:DUF2283 domain-containing protein [Promineifilum sp.]